MACNQKEKRESAQQTGARQGAHPSLVGAAGLARGNPCALAAPHPARSVFTYKQRYTCNTCIHEVERIASDLREVPQVPMQVWRHVASHRHVVRVTALSQTTWCWRINHELKTLARTQQHCFFHRQCVHAGARMQMMLKAAAIAIFFRRRRAQKAQGRLLRISIPQTF